MYQNKETPLSTKHNNQNSNGKVQMFTKCGEVEMRNNHYMTTAGVPKFLGQKIVDTKTFMDKLECWYPIIPTFMTQADASCGMRYYGYFDIDMKLDTIRCGEEALFAGLSPKKYENHKEIKTELKCRLEEGSVRGETMCELCTIVPGLRKVLLMQRRK